MYPEADAGIPIKVVLGLLLTAVLVLIAVFAYFHYSATELHEYSEARSSVSSQALVATVAPPTPSNHITAVRQRPLGVKKLRKLDERQQRRAYHEWRINGARERRRQIAFDLPSSSDDDDWWHGGPDWSAGGGPARACAFAVVGNGGLEALLSALVSPSVSSPSTGVSSEDIPCPPQLFRVVHVSDLAVKLGVKEAAVGPLLTLLSHSVATGQPPCICDRCIAVASVPLGLHLAALADSVAPRHRRDESPPASAVAAASTPSQTAVQHSSTSSPTSPSAFATAVTEFAFLHLVFSEGSDDPRTMDTSDPAAKATAERCPAAVVLVSTEGLSFVRDRLVRNGSTSIADVASLIRPML